MIRFRRRERPLQVLLHDNGNILVSIGTIHTSEDKDAFKAELGTIDLRLMCRWCRHETHHELFKSLADETRLRLLLLLHDGRTHCASPAT